MIVIICDWCGSVIKQDDNRIRAVTLQDGNVQEFQLIICKSCVQPVKDEFSAVQAKAFETYKKGKEAP